MNSPFNTKLTKEYQKILGMIPSHKIYCEPYFVFDTLFFFKGKSQVEILNDSNSNLTSFYEVCQDKERFLILYERIKNTLNFESDLNRAAKILKSDSGKYDSVDTAWALWVYSNLSTGRVMGKWELSSNLQKMHATTEKIETSRNQISKELFHRLSNVHISNRCPYTLLESADSAETFFFLRPIFNMSRRKDEKEGAIRLLDSLEALRGRFILKSKETPLLRKYIRETGWYCENLKETGEILVHNYLIEPLLFYV